MIPYLTTQPPFVLQPSTPKVYEMAMRTSVGLSGLSSWVPSDWPLLLAEIAVAVLVLQMVTPKGSRHRAWRNYLAGVVTVMLVREIERRAQEDLPTLPPFSPRTGKTAMKNPKFADPE